MNDFKPFENVRDRVVNDDIDQCIEIAKGLASVHSTEAPVTLTVFKCGPRDKCPSGTEHDYSRWENTAGGETAVCSKCGHRAIDDAWWF